MIAEYVSIAHPDRMADLMAAKLITYLQTSPEVHAAIEVMCVNKTVIFAGESNVKVDKKLLKKVVKEVMSDCGYERKSLFIDGKDYISSKKIKIINKINKQSPDIALSTTNKLGKSGWNDQGIFFASYDSRTPTGQNMTKFIAQSFGEFLFNNAIAEDDLGTDIKVLVESIDNYVLRIVVAIPTVCNGYIKKQVKVFYCKWVNEINKKYGLNINQKVSYFEVNTSGKYRKHGMIADTGLTGRKLAINCLDEQYKNGGGSMIKPWHSADLLVPLILREFCIVDKGSSLSATTSIGTNFLSVFKGDELLDIVNIDLYNEARTFGLFDGRSYYELVRSNFIC